MVAMLDPQQLERMIEEDGVGGKQNFPRAKVTLQKPGCADVVSTVSWGQIKNTVKMPSIVHHRDPSGQGPW